MDFLRGFPLKTKMIESHHELPFFPILRPLETLVFKQLPDNQLVLKRLVAIGYSSLQMKLYDHIYICGVEWEKARKRKKKPIMRFLLILVI